MDYLYDLLSDLSARLPELEWKISSLNCAISRASLPRGLFRSNMELTGAGCIQEIKADIGALAHQTEARSAHFLAERIHQKINVLVALCHMDLKKNKPSEKTRFGVSMLSTRQQWLRALEDEIQTLEVQQQAMQQALAQLTAQGNAPAILTAQAETGALERRLTLAREHLAKAMGGV